MQEQNFEKIGQAVDRIESLAAGLNIPLSPQMHVEQLKKILPEIAQQIKEGLIAETGQNPWE
jgi:hypothetical protein